MSNYDEKNGRNNNNSTNDTNCNATKGGIVTTLLIRTQGTSFFNDKTGQYHNMNSKQ